jgi:hypothetical protein
MTRDRKSRIRDNAYQIGIPFLPAIKASDLASRDGDFYVKLSGQVVGIFRTGGRNVL